MLPFPVIGDMSNHSSLGIGCCRGKIESEFRERKDYVMSATGSDDVRWRPKQREGAPPWDELRPEVITWCERSRSALEVELRRHPEGNHNWEIVSGAIEYCVEVIPVIEGAPDWESACAANGSLSTSIPLWSRMSKKYRAIGRSTISDRVTLGIQTGQIREIDVPGDLPLVKPPAP